MLYSINLIDTLVYPIFVLVYSYYKFDFDRPLYETRKKYLNAGTFDDSAIIFADPYKVSLFKSGFDTLRQFTYFQVIMRLVQNLIFTARVQSFVLDAKKIIENPMIIQEHLKNQKRSPKWVGAAFLLYGVAVVASVCGVIHKAETNCAAVPGCQGFAYQLTSDGSCPCIYMIDRNTALKYLSDWDKMEDVTAKISSVGTPGRQKAHRVPGLAGQVQRPARSVSCISTPFSASWQTL